jgi:hypothetical protein
MIGMLLREYWPVLVAVVSLASSVASMVFKRSVPSRTEHEALAGRVATLEQQLGTVPTREDLHALLRDMERFRGDMRVAAEQMTHARDAVGKDIAAVKELFRAEIGGARDLIVRTENLLGLVNQHLISEGKP